MLDDKKLAILEEVDGLSYHIKVDDRKVWMALLSCQNGKPQKLVYKNYVSGLRVTVQETTKGAKARVCGHGTLSPSEVTGVFPPHLADEQGNPTRVPAFVANIQTFIESQYTPKPV